jgi:hypothetical protein
MKQALEALETCTEGDYSTGHVIHPSFDEKAVTDAITALRAAIEEAEKCELVAFVADGDVFWYRPVDADALPDGTKLYTAPQPAIPAGMVLVKLFDLENAIESYEGEDGQSCLRILRNIIAAAPKPPLDAAIDEAMKG